MTPKHLDSSSSSSVSGSSCTKIGGGVARRVPLRTPHRTPLKLNTNNSTTKKTPHTKTNDRYIPNRINTNLEAGYHMLTKRDAENIPMGGGGGDGNSGSDSSINSNGSSTTSGGGGNGSGGGGGGGHMDTVKRKLLSDMCLMTGGGQQTGEKQDKLLNLHSRSVSSSDLSDLVTSTFGAGFSISTTSSLMNGNGFRRPGGTRHIPATPEKILDAPDFRDDFYLNLIDWSRSNLLAVALDKDLYIWNASTKEISQLFAMDATDDSYITSVAWLQRGDVLAVGTSKHTIELWDAGKSSLVRVMSSHRSRVGSLAWNSYLLASGSRTGHIHTHDVRTKDHHVGSLNTHKQEVCGLKWSADGRHLASGANDNKVCVWDYSMTHHNAEPRPLLTISEHTAAVKALAWCPWQSSLLATGGGTTDGKIHVWSVASGARMASMSTGAQVSSLLWSSAYHELISSHGYQLNQLSIWRYPEMSKQTDLIGHTNRVLSMVQSPDEEMVASVAADETLRFWRCFPLDERSKPSGVSGAGASGVIDRKASSQTSLARFIR